jgi:hypothetical protein
VKTFPEQSSALPNAIASEDGVLTLTFSKGGVATRVSLSAEEVAKLEMALRLRALGAPFEATFAAAPSDSGVPSPAPPEPQPDDCSTGGAGGPGRLEIACVTVILLAIIGLAIISILRSSGAQI